MNKKNTPTDEIQSRVTNCLEEMITLSGTIDHNPFIVAHEFLAVFYFLHDTNNTITFSIPTVGVPALEIQMHRLDPSLSDGCPWTIEKDSQSGSHVCWFASPIGVYEITITLSDIGGGIAMVGTVAMKR